VVSAAAPVKTRRRDSKRLFTIFLPADCCFGSEG
jgi:hypothetical protein